MIRWLLLLVGGALLGGIVHLITVIILPRTATQDAYSRLTPLVPVNTVVPLAPPTPEKAVMPFMDPAFASAVCRYDLTDGPLKLAVPVSPAYTSVSFYTRYDVAYYAINDRAAGRRVIELDLMTAAQREELPEDEEITAAERVIYALSDEALARIRGTGNHVQAARKHDHGRLSVRSGDSEASQYETKLHDTSSVQRSDSMANSAPHVSMRVRTIASRSASRAPSSCSRRAALRARPMAPCSHDAATTSCWPRSRPPRPPDPARTSFR